MQILKCFRIAHGYSFPISEGWEREGDLPSVPTAAGIQDCPRISGMSPSEGGWRKTK